MHISSSRWAQTWAHPVGFSLSSPPSELRLELTWWASVSAHLPVDLALDPSIYSPLNYPMELQLCRNIENKKSCPRAGNSCSYWAIQDPKNRSLDLYQFTVLFTKPPGSLQHYSWNHWLLSYQPFPKKTKKTGHFPIDVSGIFPILLEKYQRKPWNQWFCE